MLNQCRPFFWRFLCLGEPPSSLWHIFRSFFLSEKFTTLQLFKILIEPKDFDWWKRFTMGRSSSSQSASGTDGIKNQDQNNYGLVTLASENLDSNSWNFLEIFICGMVLISCLYLLRWWCVRHRAKKLLAMREALQSVQIQPHVARGPVL